MTLPNVNVTVRDGALGISGANADNVFALVGACSKITPGVTPTPITLASVDDVKSTLGYGPLAELAAHVLAVAGGSVICVPTARTNGSITGSPFAPTHADGSAGTTPTLAASGNPLDRYRVKIGISTGGAATAAQFTYSLDNGVTTSGPLWMTGTGSIGTIQKNAGAQTDLSWTQANGAGNVPASYQVKVTSVGSSQPASTATFGYNTDSSSNYPLTATKNAGNTTLTLGANGPVLTIASGATFNKDDVYTFTQTASYPIAENDGTPTGITLTFSPGTYVAGDTYAWTCAGMSSTKNDVDTALTALLSASLAFSMVVVNSASVLLSDVSDIAASLDAKLTTHASGRFAYVRGLVLGTPLAVDNSNTNTLPDTYNTTFNGPSSMASYLRAMVAGGAVSLTSALTGRRNLRSSGMPLAARLMLTPVQTHPGQYNLGALPFVVAMGDMGAGQSNSDSTAFDNARIATVRTFDGVPGVYIARGVTLAPSTSDYSSIQNARVMDKACRLTRTALLQYLNSQVEVNGDGTVTERQAKSIEASVNSTLTSQLINTGNAVSAEVVVNRTANVLSTKTLPVSVRVLPFGYAEFITLDIGFRRLS